MLSFLWYIHEIFFLIPLVPVIFSVLYVNILCLILVQVTNVCCLYTAFTASELLSEGKGRIFQHTLK